MELITSKIVAEKLTSYLHHELNLPELVDWAEQVMMDSDFETKNYEAIRNVVSRIGVADVKAFGLMWEDFEKFFEQLGYSVRIEVVA